MTGRHRADVGVLAPALVGLSESLPAPARTAATALAVALPITGGMVAVSPAAQAYTVNDDGSVTVQKGDTISEISMGEGVSTQSTLDANGLGWNTLIYPGQVFMLGTEARYPNGQRPAPLAAVPPAARSTPADSPAPADQGTAATVVAEALSHIGLPYVWAGNSPTSGFDCSGFTKYVYAKVGVNLPRYSGDQARQGTRVSASEARAGDLVSFNGYEHVAIYLGDGYIIDSPRAGKTIQKRKLWTDNVQFRRIL